MLSHTVLGYSFSELSSIFLLITGLGGWIIWLTHHFLSQPLQMSIDNLTKMINEFQKNSKLEHEDFKEHFEKIDSKLEEHNESLITHEERIKTLFKNSKKEENDEK